MYSCGPPLMDVQEWDDQHELTYSSYVRTRDVTLKTCRRRWMIGRDGERRSGISAQAAQHDEDEMITYHFEIYATERTKNKWNVPVNHKIIYDKTLNYRIVTFQRQLFPFWEGTDCKTYPTLTLTCTLAEITAWDYPDKLTSIKIWLDFTNQIPQCPVGWGCRIDTPHQRVSWIWH